MMRTTQTLVSTARTPVPRRNSRRAVVICTGNCFDGRIYYSLNFLLPSQSPISIPQPRDLETPEINTSIANNPSRTLSDIESMNNRLRDLRRRGCRARGRVALRACHRSERHGSSLRPPDRLQHRLFHHRPHQGHLFIQWKGPLGYQHQCFPARCAIRLGLRRGGAVHPDGARAGNDQGS
jgi:hypothetical protein